MMDKLDHAQRIALVKETVSHLVHLHYCSNDVDAVLDYFAPQFTWECVDQETRLVNRQDALTYFTQLQTPLDKSSIQDEQYDVIELAPDSYVCSGSMWISSDSRTQLFLRIYQRLLFVFRWEEGRLLCTHLYCSNPYLDLLEWEHLYQPTIQPPDARQQQIENEAKLKRPLGQVQEPLLFPDTASSLDGHTPWPDAQPSATSAPDEGTPSEPEVNDSGPVQAGAPELFPSQTPLNNQLYAIGHEHEPRLAKLYSRIEKENNEGQPIPVQQQLLQHIYDTLPCGILRFTRQAGQYKVISLNRTALDMLFYDTEDQFLADWRNGISGTVMAEDRRALQRSNDILKQVGDSIEISYRTCQPNGPVRWLTGNNTLISTKKGVDVIQHIVFDVSERKLLQEQMSREQEIYRVAMESRSDTMYEYLVKEDMLVVYLPQQPSSEISNILRREVPHFRQQLSSSKIVHPGDVQLVIDNICNGRTELFEARFTNIDHSPNPDYSWCRVTGKPIIHGGQLLRMVGTIQNIHQEKLAMSANMEQLHMNQSALLALTNIYTTIFYVDLPTDQYYAVRTSQTDSNFSPPRMGCFQRELSHYILTSVCHEDRDRLLPYASPDFLSQRLRSVGDRVEVEYRNHRQRRPEQTWMQLEFQLISTEDGAPHSLICAFRNITLRRRLAVERNREVQQARRALEDTYESANQANQAKSSFLSKMSHDMRTPLNAIIGMTSIAKQHLSNQARAEDCLEKIYLSSQLLLQLINEVLDMSKIESSDFGLTESVFELPKLINQTLDMLHFELECKHHTLDLNIGPLEHRVVSGDQMRIQQILLNLLSNSIKYTQDGGRISLSVTEAPHSARDTGCYTLVIQDNGIGMSPEFQERLFIPFERADDIRVSKVQGTGLGMSIAKNLVQMMHGTIKVDSQPGQGSCFTVTLCLKGREPGQHQPPADTSAQKPFTVPPSTRVLVVEDNSLNREISRDMLETSGLLVDEAEDGAQALELFCQSPVDYYQLILMDIQMPVMDGYQATQAIRALARPDAATIPIIALTANAFVDDVSHAHQAGMNEHLSKPLELDRLIQALRLWLP